MVKLEEITSKPTFSNQLENKVLYSDHTSDISISYSSTYTIKYVIEGEKTYRHDNQQVELSKDQFLIINNGCKITTEAKKGTKGLSFFLSKDLIKEVYQFYNIADISADFLEVAQKNSTSSTGLLLKSAAYLYANDTSAFKQQMDNLFLQLSEEIVKEQVQVAKGFVVLNIVKTNTQKELFTQINLAKEYLNDNLEKSISLEKLSKTIGLSKYYLHRLFKEVNGSSPLVYLTQIRLNKARNYLQNSKCSIAEIGMLCGFEEPAYFSNTFKKYVGVSPIEFRLKS
ncbi:helix-turn-helix transcriptional regulator [Roseivirga sp.]|uniref:helix-turn-helix transcriptional regulator n=1 Tax=Roseivirga sp. TaxID=1964215 RepID=UPI003B8E7B32